MAATGNAATSVSDKMCMNDDVEANAKTATRNELLCFMQQKAGFLAFDHLVKLCVDFYGKEEIIAAQSMTEQFTARRLSKQQGGDAMKAKLEDIAKLLLDPDVKVPTFYAVDLGRLPPVSEGALRTTAGSTYGGSVERRSEV